MDIDIAIVWLIVFIVLLAIEIVTLSLATIWFAGGALVAFFATLLGANTAVQLILFIVVSSVLLFFTRPFAVKFINKGRTKTNVETMAGKVGIVSEAIDNIRGQGKVTVNGQEWTSRAADDNMIIEKDSLVIVQNVSGVKLMVTRKEEEI